MSDLSPEDLEMLYGYLNRQSVDPNDSSHDLISSYPQLAQAPVTPSGDFDLGEPDEPNVPDVSAQGEGPISAGLPPGTPDQAPPMPAQPAPAMPAPGAPVPATPLPTSIGQVVGDKYSDAARQQLYDNLRQRSVGAIIGDAMAGLGDSINNSYGTGAQSHALQNTMQAQATAKNNALQEFERGRNEQLQNFDQGLKLTQASRDNQAFQQQQAVAAQNRDPNSASSQRMQALAAQATGKDPSAYTGQTAEQLMKELPILQKAYGQQLHADALKGSLDVRHGEKDDQFQQREWDKIVKDTDPLTASNRTPLGAAAKANMNADRALATLSKPVVTNQEAGNVMSDIAGIYQGGSPTQFGMSHQQYNSIYGNVMGAIQTLTGRPQDAMPDPIKQRLIGVLQDMKGTNAGIIKQQLDLTERTKGKVISHYPDEWTGLRQTLEGSGPAQSTPQQAQQQGGAAGPHGKSVVQNGVTYNWNPSTNQYE